MKVHVKVYIDKYDIQGSDTEVNVNTLEEWKKTKQTIIEDFIKKFDVSFKNKYKYDMDKFGIGTYKDNKQNRMKKRVGMIYDKGSALKDKLKSIIMNRTMNIMGESVILNNLESPFKIPEELKWKKRNWTEEEEKYVLNKRKEGLMYKQISDLIFRKPSSISSKVGKVKHKYKIYKGR